jgi:hypothetical protein
LEEVGCGSGKALQRRFHDEQFQARDARETALPRIGNPIRFKGNGGKTLPPFTLSRGKTMYWTNKGRSSRPSLPG